MFCLTIAGQQRIPETAYFRDWRSFYSTTDAKNCLRWWPQISNCLRHRKI